MNKILRQDKGKKEQKWDVADWLDLFLMRLSHLTMARPGLGKSSLPAQGGFAHRKPLQVYARKISIKMESAV
jgi:hypothetical protein